MPAPNANNPLLKTLRRLPAKSRRRFIRYLESELYTKRKGLAPAAIAIIDVIGGKKMVAQGITSAQLTYLRAELDTFLSIDYLLQDETSMMTATISAHRVLKDTKRATKLIKNRQRTLTKGSVANARERLRLEEFYFLDLIPSTPEHLTSMLRINTLRDRLYFAEKLQQACHLAAYKTVSSTDKELPLLQHSIQLVTNNKALQEDPFVGLYYQAYLILMKDERADRKELIRYLKENPAWMEDRDFRDFYLTLLNDAIRKSNTGTEGYEEFALDLFKKGLATGLLLVNGHISGPSFYNVTIVAVKLGEHCWVETFHQTYSQLLTKHDQLTYYPYARARFALAKGDALLADEELARFDHAAGSVVTQMQARVLQIRLDFELNRRELLDSHLNSLLVFLSRHKELGYHREINIAFIRLCQRLSQLPPRISPKQRATITLLVNEFPIAGYREWMLTQIPGNKAALPLQRKAGQ